MEVRLQPAKEAQFAEIAAKRGLKPDELAQQVLSRYLEDDARFIEAVNLRLAAADRGEFVEHEEVWANVGLTSRSCCSPDASAHERSGTCLRAATVRSCEEIEPQMNTDKR